MESFRKVIKGWLGKVLLILFLIPLALVGIEGYFSSGKSKDAAKTVNGQEISNKELDNATKSYSQQYLSYVNGDETLLNQSFIKDKALESLIARNLLLQQAEKLGVSLSDAQIEQMIAQQPSLQENGKFSEALYANYLKSVGLTSQALIENLRQDHALKMMTSTLMDYALVSKVDIQQIANLQTEQRTIHLASIKLDDYKKGIQVSQQEITDYYNKHKNEFRQVASVDVDFVVLSPSNLPAANVQISDAELQQAYAKFVEAEKAKVQPQVKHILIAVDSRTDAEAKKLADDVSAKIKAGMSFAEAAQKYSDDTASKGNGGVIAAYDKGFFGNAFDSAVAALKSGQISAPVKTQYGYHIISAEAPAVKLPAFEVEKPRLIAEVQKAKSANAFSDAVNNLNEMVVGSDALDTVAQEVKGVQVQSIKGLTLGMQHPVLSEANVKAKLFNEDVKNGDRNASSNIQLANGDVVWVKVRDYHAAGEQSLAEANTRVKAKIIEVKAAAAAKAKIQKTLDEFKTQPAATVMAKNQLSFEDAGIFTRSQGLKRQVERAAFSVPAPKAGMWSVTTATLPNEFVVVAISNVNKTAANALTPEQLAELSKLYQQLRGQQELDDYTQYLKSQAKIK
ncbi:SurA N-terminal domain-containing protein [Acinetobacter zhairhuonensis]|uniref:SurA N-terminal domain-containing protein n=1 Tax=Acinetobacter sp. A7.4 TaxID=2919921 RepID=UPI001F4FFC28|nr:SurA N-terminal domain-containing protein [Acinetobacter sp. A7.4]MCJ8161772.1 SurA N-terminal domain-containing protein [Acinetobacter sp. A7.4]